MAAQNQLLSNQQPPAALDDVSATEWRKAGDTQPGIILLLAALDDVSATEWRSPCR